MIMMVVVIAMVTIMMMVVLAVTVLSVDSAWYQPGLHHPHHRAPLADHH